MTCKRQAKRNVIEEERKSLMAAGSFLEKERVQNEHRGAMSWGLSLYRFPRCLDSLGSCVTVRCYLEGLKLNWTAG